MKLKHTLLLGLLVHGLEGAISLPAHAQSNWQYIIDANDGTLYFGRNVQHFEGVTFLEIKSEADPEGNNGDKHAWKQPFRCEENTYMEKDGTWKAIDPDSVGQYWMNFACASRTKLSDRKSVAV